MTVAITRAQYLANIQSHGRGDELGTNKKNNFKKEKNYAMGCIFEYLLKSFQNLRRNMNLQVRHHQNLGRPHGYPM